MLIVLAYEGGILFPFEDELDIIGRMKLMMVKRKSMWKILCLQHQWSPLSNVRGSQDWNGLIWRCCFLMTTKFSLWRVFVVVPTHMILLTRSNLAIGMLVISSLSPSLTPMCIPLKGFLLHRWPLQSVMLEGVSLRDHE